MSKWNTHYALCTLRICKHSELNSKFTIFNNDACNDESNSCHYNYVFSVLRSLSTKIRFLHKKNTSFFCLPLSRVQESDVMSRLLCELLWVRMRHKRNKLFSKINFIIRRLFGFCTYSSTNLFLVERISISLVVRHKIYNVKNVTNFVLFCKVN